MRGLRWGTLLVAGALLFGACSGSKTAAKVKTVATTTTVAPTSTSLSPQDEVVAAYRAYWAAWSKAGLTSDSSSPGLLDHTTGVQLNRVKKAFDDYKAKGVVVRGNIELAPRVVAFNPPNASLRDCIADHTLSYDASGQTHDTDDQIRRHLSITLVQDAGTWKVSDIVLEDKGCTSA